MIVVYKADKGIVCFVSSFAPNDKAERCSQHRFAGARGAAVSAPLFPPLVASVTFGEGSHPWELAGEWSVPTFTSNLSLITAVSSWESWLVGPFPWGFPLRLQDTDMRHEESTAYFLSRAHA